MLLCVIVRLIFANCIKVIAFSLSFVICYGTHYGLGRHEDTVIKQGILGRLEYTFTALYVGTFSFRSFPRLIYLRTLL